MLKFKTEASSHVYKGRLPPIPSSRVAEPQANQVISSISTEGKWSLVIHPLPITYLPPQHFRSESLTIHHSAALVFHRLTNYSNKYIPHAAPAAGYRGDPPPPQADCTDHVLRLPGGIAGRRTARCMGRGGGGGVKSIGTADPVPPHGFSTARRAYPGSDGVHYV